MLTDFFILHKAHGSQKIINKTTKKCSVSPPLTE